VTGEPGAEEPDADVPDAEVPAPRTGAEADPEAYGRVTDAARFAPLHAVADALVEELASAYDVRVETGTDLDEAEYAAGADVERVVSLVPVNADASPLRFVFTRFPGVVLGFGRWSSESFPSCGCDACDEDPDELARELTARCRAVVAGHLRESLRGGIKPWLTTEFATGTWASRSGHVVSRQRYRALGGRATHEWRPWRPASHVRVISR
jgi:hypothetical protein